MPGECTTQWCWQNRWYRARGFSWHGSGWSAGGGIRFYDEGILSETVGEAGITFAGGWDWKTQEAQMTAIGQGIVMFGQKLSAGLSQLKNLLGGGASIAQGSCFGRPCALPPGTSTVRMPKSADATWNMQTIVHELAHIIDWHSKIQIGTTVSFGELPVYGHFSDAWAGEPLTMYAAGQDGAIFNHQWETWAEAVTVWVFGGSYKASERPLHVDVGSQMVRISELLNGWR